MKSSMKYVTAGIAGLLITGVSLTAFSGQGKDEDDNSPQIINQATLNINQAITIALADVPGKVIQAEIERDDGKLFWEVEVLDGSNQVYQLEIDANNGQVLEKEKDKEDD